jgi:undecaprenyl-diphosphatase
MSYLQSIIIAIVQGLTEFLPVSSTGHQIITESLMGLDPDDKFIRAFTVCIQLGSILAVLVLYWKRFLQSVKFYYKLLIAFIPAVIFGLLFKYTGLAEVLSNVWVVAVMLLLGGFVFLFVDKWFRRNETEGRSDISYPSAFIVGLFQCIAMIPGVSRSAATIIGGMTQKMNRRHAAEFSFFLAVPTMFAATALELLDIFREGSVTPDQLKILAVGNIVSFVVAALAIKAFISILTRYGFKFFGYYRIALGAAIIVLLLLGYDLKIIG